MNSRVETNIFQQKLCLDVNTSWDSAIQTAGSWLQRLPSVNELAGREYARGETMLTDARHEHHEPEQRQTSRTMTTGGRAGHHTKTASVLCYAEQNQVRKPYKTVTWHT